MPAIHETEGRPLRPNRHVYLQLRIPARLSADYTNVINFRRLINETSPTAILSGRMPIVASGVFSHYKYTRSASFSVAYFVVVERLYGSDEDRIKRQYNIATASNKPQQTAAASGESAKRIRIKSLQCRSRIANPPSETLSYLTRISHQELRR